MLKGQLLVSVLKENFRLEPQNTRIAQGEIVLLECGPPVNYFFNFVNELP